MQKCEEPLLDDEDPEDFGASSITVTEGTLEKPGLSIEKSMIAQ